MLLAVANPCLFACLGFFVCLFLQYLQLCLRGRKVETVSHHVIQQQLKPISNGYSVTEIPHTNVNKCLPSKRTMASTLVRRKQFKIGKLSFLPNYLLLFQHTRSFLTTQVQEVDSLVNQSTHLTVNKTITE